MAGGPFKPGPDPRRNAGGRPKAIKEVVELARTHTPRAIERLAEVLEGDDDKAAVAAANALLDRAWGKPSQEITGADGGPLVIAHLTDDQLAVIAAKGGK